MKIEFENWAEVAASLNDPSGFDETRVEATIIGEGVPSARAVLEECLKDAEKYKNLIVIRFDITEAEDERCHTESELRMAVADPHAAIHGTEAIRCMLEKLKEQVAMFLLDDLMRKRFGGGK